MTGAGLGGAIRSPVYAGFWRRLGAAGMDCVVFGVPLVFVGYGLQMSGVPDGDVQQAVAGQLWPDTRLALFENLLPALVTIAFWALLGATPGKFLLECRVVEARTGRRPGWLRAGLRYLCYLVSMLPLGLGFLWIAWDRRKQGWHDKLAGTLVVVEDVAVESTEELERLVAD